MEIENTNKRLKNRLARERKINRNSINTTLENRNRNTFGRDVAEQMWLCERLIKYSTTLTGIWHSNMKFLLSSTLV